MYFLFLVFLIIHTSTHSPFPHCKNNCEYTFLTKSCSDEHFYSWMKDSEDLWKLRNVHIYPWQMISYNRSDFSPLKCFLCECVLKSQLDTNLSYHLVYVLICNQTVSLRVQRAGSKYHIFNTGYCFTQYFI